MGKDIFHWYLSCKHHLFKHKLFPYWGNLKKKAFFHVPHSELRVPEGPNHPAATDATFSLFQPERNTLQPGH